MDMFSTLFFFLVGLAVLVYGYREPASRWLSYMFFFTGMGNIGTMFYKMMLSLEAPSALYLAMPDWLSRLTTGVTSYFSQCFFPLSTFIFSLYYCGFVDAKTVARIRNFAVIPVIVTITTTPIQFAPGSDPIPDYNLPLLFTWGWIYELVAVILLFACCFAAKDVRQKRSRILHFVLLGLPLLYDLTFSLIDSGLFDADVVITKFMLIVFLAGSVKYGLMGIKINIRQQSLSQSSRTMISGAAVINHTLQQEIGKIKLLLEHSEPDSQTEQAVLLNNACDHLLQMTHYIKERAGNFELNLGKHSLDVIVSEALTSAEPLLLKRGVQLTLSPSLAIPVVCDSNHLIAALKELLANAAEAIDHGHGEINFNLSASKHYINIRITDNGSGMTPEVATQAPEPFFTTKMSEFNEGLGLSYAYSVFEKHGGSMTLSSEPNVGTLVVAELPRKRI